MGGEGRESGELMESKSLCTITSESSFMHLCVFGSLPGAVKSFAFLCSFHRVTYNK